ncbi:MAG: hypothetical protein RR619_07045, partial [Raoultibacter sp.]
ASGLAHEKRGEDLLYLAPANALGAGGRNEIQDRTKQGRGFTVSELDELQVIDNGYRRLIENWSMRGAYLADRSNWLMKDAKLAEVLEPTRQKQAYIDECIHQNKTLKTQVTNYHALLEQHILSMKAEINSHLWISSEFAGPASEKLKQTQSDVEALLARVSRLIEGFELLPVEAALDYFTADDERTAEDEQEKISDEEANAL